MDQITSATSPPLTFTLVNFPNARVCATLAFREGRLIGQLTYGGAAPEFRGRLALGQHVFDGKRVVCANGAYGEAESYWVEPVDPYILKAFNGGAR